MYVTCMCASFDYMNIDLCAHTHAILDVHVIASNVKKETRGSKARKIAKQLKGPFAHTGLHRLLVAGRQLGRLIL